MIAANTMASVSPEQVLGRPPGGTVKLLAPSGAVVVGVCRDTVLGVGADQHTPRSPAGTSPSR
jgi:hypothetical protein